MFRAQYEISFDFWRLFYWNIFKVLKHIFLKFEDLQHTWLKNIIDALNLFVFWTILMDIFFQLLAVSKENYHKTIKKIIIIYCIDYEIERVLSLDFYPWRFVQFHGIFSSVLLWKCLLLTLPSWYPIYPIFFVFFRYTNEYSKCKWKQCQTRTWPK